VLLRATPPPPSPPSLVKEAPLTDVRLQYVLAEQDTLLRVDRVAELLSASSIANLTETFTNLRKYIMKLNPKKYLF
jgi:hypothetical protein